MSSSSVKSVSINGIEDYIDPDPEFFDLDDDDPSVSVSVTASNTSGLVDMKDGGSVSVSSAVSAKSATSALRLLYFEELSNHLKVGIIGTTNIGKSTLFNLMTRSHVYSYVENALFSTIDPFIAITTPHDPRMEYLKQCFPAAKRVYPARITVIDTAGIVAGSFRNDRGVGVSSLESLKEVDVICMVLKCFNSTELAKYNVSLFESCSSVSYDPVGEIRMVEQELMLMDLYNIEDKLWEIEGILEEVSTAQYLVFQYNLLLRLWKHLAGVDRPTPPKRYKGKTPKFRTKMPISLNGFPVRLGKWDLKDREAIASYKLFTVKEMVFVANVSAVDCCRKHTLLAIDHMRAFLAERSDKSRVVTLSTELEQRLFDLEKENLLGEYLSLNPSHASGIPRLLSEINAQLRIIHYYTASKDEVKCSMLRSGKSLLDAVMRKDVNIGRQFIQAEIISYEDYNECEGDIVRLRMESKIRQEGRRYVVSDGDLIHSIRHHPCKPVEP